MNQRQQPSWTLTGRWVFPVETAPLEDGMITVRGERIEAVEPRAGRQADVDFGNVALLPGLVNAHTHLDLSGLRGKTPPSANFTDWLRRVIQVRRNLSPEQIREDVHQGMTEALVSGTTLIGDICALGQSWPVLAEAPVRAVVYHEMLGLTRPRAHGVWASACDWLRMHSATATCRPGLSPHAPYSVRRTLFRAAASLSRQQKISLAVHLAETQEELELLAHRRGSFVDFLAELGAWDPGGLVAGPGEVIEMTRCVPSILFAHGNYLDPGTLAGTESTLVYCPRTHAAFGHPPYPLREFLAAGVRVALGTDSLASNPDLDLLAEARFLRRQAPELSGATLLHMATLAGAEALGWQQETGSLIPGKSADLVVLPVLFDEATDPHDLLFTSVTAVQAVLSRGRWVHLNVPGMPSACPV